MNWWQHDLDDGRLGNYRIEEKLGQGGMAEVFRAVAVAGELTGRTVAIKVPRIGAIAPEHLDQYLKRFQREIELQSAGAAPAHVATMLGAGEVTDKRGIRRPYLVMDYYSGGSLGSRLGGAPGRRPHPQSLKQVLDWLLPIARALDRLHGPKGARLHRDVKPENILFDEADDPFLADFGVATTLDELGSYLGGGSGLPSPGSGGYSAPETLGGSKQSKYPASDQFSLAATVYEALSGRLPVDVTNAQAYWTALANWQPTHLFERCPELPRAAADAVMRSLSAKPADRFQSCSDFAKVLADATQQPRQPEPPPPPPPPQSQPRSQPQPPPPPKKNIGRWLMLAAAVVVTVLAVVIVRLLPSPATALLSRGPSFGSDSVVVIGHGLIPDAGMPLSPGQYSVRVKADGYDEFKSEPCWVGDIDLRNDLTLNSSSYEGWEREESCLISFDDPSVRILTVGGIKRRVAWHGAGLAACVYSGSIAFLDGKRVAFSKIGPFDPGLDSVEHNTECRGGLDSYFEPGGNRYGGEGADVSVCMDGNRAIAIYNGYYRTDRDIREVIFSEFKVQGRELELQILGRISGMAADKFSEETHNELVRCEGESCVCNAVEWLADHGRAKEQAIEMIAALAPPAAFGTSTVLSVRDAEQFLGRIGDYTDGFGVDYGYMLNRVWGHPHGDLWLVRDIQADAYMALWTEAEGPQPTGKNTADLKFQMPYTHRVRYHPKGEEWRTSSLTMMCENNKCRLFDALRLELSSEFSDSMVEYSTDKSGAGVSGYEVTASLSWRPWLQINKENAFLEPVLADMKSAGLGPQLDLAIEVSSSCSEDSSINTYKNTVEDLVRRVNSASDPEWVVPWQIKIEATSGDNPCSITPLFEGRSHLSASWAGFRNITARASAHVWQALHAATDDLLIRRDENGNLLEVLGVRSDEGSKASAIREALDRNTSISGVIESAACVDIKDSRLGVWRVQPTHSIVYRSAPNSVSGWTNTILSASHIIVDVREVKVEDQNLLVYFWPDGSGWRYVQWDIARQTETLGAWLDSLPSAWCLLDPQSRRVLSVSRDCPECSPERKQW